MEEEVFESRLVSISLLESCRRCPIRWSLQTQLSLSVLTLLQHPNLQWRRLLQLLVLQVVRLLLPLGAQSTDEMRAQRRQDELVRHLSQVLDPQDLSLQHDRLCHQVLSHLIEGLYHLYLHHDRLTAEQR